MLLADVTPLPCLFIRQTILNNCHVIASGIVKKGTPPFLCSKCDFSLRHLPSGSADKISSCIVSVVGTVLDVGEGCFFGVCGLHCNGGDVRPNFNCDPIKKSKFFLHMSSLGSSNLAFNFTGLFPFPVER